MKKITLFIYLTCILQKHFYAQTHLPDDIESQIKLVENNLSGRIRINGKVHSIAERMAYYKVKGLSIAVIHNYKIAWAKGYGWADEQEKRPVTPETLFEPGSISKSLNAVGVLKLVQDKKLDLDTDINTYLRSWKFPYDSLSRHKKITLAHLLSHTAGLTVHGFPGYHRKAKLPTLPQILDGKAPANSPAVRSKSEPGLRFKYSGGGTTISQLIICDITNQPYAKYMDEQVLKPMGMLNSSFSQPPAKHNLRLLATGYERDGSEVSGKFHVYPDQGAAGLWMTPSDLCHYIIETQLAYEGRSSKVLSPEMTRLRLTPYIDKSSAFGVFIEQRGAASYFQHSAANEGFSGQYYGSLEGGNGVVIFLNANHFSMIQELINSVAYVYQWKDFYTPVTKDEIILPDSLLKTYEGIYLFGNMWAGIGKRNNMYHFYTDNQLVKMHYYTSTSFFNEEFGAEKELVKNEKGEVIGYDRRLNDKVLGRAVKILDPDTLRLQNYEFGNIAWYLFENKNYEEAIAYCRRGLELYPDDIGLLSKMAHAYLYSNNYDPAINIYKTDLKELLRPDSYWEAMMQETLIYFKDNGYDVQIYDKVFSDLKLKKPKGH